MTPRVWAYEVHALPYLTMTMSRVEQLARCDYFGALSSYFLTFIFWRWANQSVKLSLVKKGWGGLRCRLKPAHIGWLNL